MKPQFKNIVTRGTFFSVTSPKDKMPMIFCTLAQAAPGNWAARLAGGCKMSEEKQAGMVPYFLQAFNGRADGVVISGATDSEGKTMITNIPGELVLAGNDCAALGSCPRTADLSLEGNPHGGAKLHVSKYGDTIDTNQHAVVVVQKNASEVSEWDGDVEYYLDYLQGLRDHAEYSVGVIIFNGGGVTVDELKGAIARNIPVIVIEGSERAADDFIAQYRDGASEVEFDYGAKFIAELQGKPELVDIVSFDDPSELTAALEKRGLIAEVAVPA